MGKYVPYSANQVARYSTFFDVPAGRSGFLVPTQ